MNAMILACTHVVIPIILAISRRMQEEQEFQVIFSYRKFEASLSFLRHVSHKGEIVGGGGCSLVPAAPL